MLAILHHLWPVSLLGLSPSTQTCPNISLFWCPTESPQNYPPMCLPSYFLSCARHSGFRGGLPAAPTSLLRTFQWVLSSISKTDPVPSLDCPQPQLPVTFPRILHEHEACPNLTPTAFLHHLLPMGEAQVCHHEPWKASLDHPPSPCPTATHRLSLSLAPSSTVPGHLGFPRPPLFLCLQCSFPPSFLHLG